MNVDVWTAVSRNVRINALKNVIVTIITAVISYGL